MVYRQRGVANCPVQPDAGLNGCCLCTGYVAESLVDGGEVARLDDAVVIAKQVRGVQRFG